MKSKSLIVIIVAIFAIIAYNGFYTIDETEQVVITQFGRIVGKPKLNPGLNFKVPFIQKANFFPKNLLQWDGDPGQIPTLGKTFIWVDVFARWKIVEPVTFFQAVNNQFNAIGKLNDIIDPAVRNFITSHRLIEAVRNTNREMDTIEEMDTIGGDSQAASGGDTIPATFYVVNTGRAAITRGILEQAQPKLAEFGIELVDVKIKRINYVEEVRKSVYGRMIAERKQIAEKFRSEGKGEARKILGDKERDLKQITSQAYKTAQEIKGKADAESTRIFAEAFNKDPEFYSFSKTLEIYSESLDKNSELILSTDSEFFKYLKGYMD
jgi:membrane protease subunit HflC